MFASPSRRARNPSIWFAARVEGGVGSELELDQAKTLVASAQVRCGPAGESPASKPRISSISCSARIPDPSSAAMSLIDQPQPPAIPAGLPSALLERRPDLRAAEQQLIAANARVGVAKAAFYPSINLTGAGGIGTTDLLGVVSRSGFTYTMAGTVGPARSSMRADAWGTTRRPRRSARSFCSTYQKAIHGAFREVSDALIGHQKSKEYTTSQKLLTETLRDQSRLANMRYIGGVSSYLEVLDTERQRLTAEQQLAQAQRDVLTTLVQLYKALGGGWQ